jgi:hypothetical protein
LISVIEDGEEEKEQQLAEMISKPAQKELPAKESAKNHLLLKQKLLCTTKKFGLKWGHGNDKVINWKILAAGEHIKEDPLDIPNSVEYVSAAGDTELSADMDLNDLFLVRSVVGHAKIIDEFHADHRLPFHNILKNDQIQLDDPEAEDPDWKVKHAYTLMIVAESEIDNGVNNLWNCGPLGGCHDYPDFEKYIMPISPFKVFQAAAPYGWCKKKHWYVEKCDRSWDIFRRCLKETNSHQARLLKTYIAHV